MHAGTQTLWNVFSTHPQTLWIVFTQRVSLYLGLQQSGTVSWVLRDDLDAQHLLGTLIRLGIRHPRKKVRKKERQLSYPQMKSPCPWDTHYQFSIKTSLSQKEIVWGWYVRWSFFCIWGREGFTSLSLADPSSARRHWDVIEFSEAADSVHVRTCPQKNGWHERSTILYWRPSLQTWACQRPDWVVYSKRGRQVCIASTCLLVNFWKAGL